MPARVETTSAIGTAPAACDVYDMDNIFLTDEGWVYRHYKKADKSQFWDEILVAGEVVSGATIGGVANDPVDAINDASPTFEVGDGTVDFENSPLYSDGGGAAPDPSTSIGELTISGDTSANDGDTKSYSVDTSNATASDLTYSWTADDDAAITSGANTDTVTVAITYSAGNATVTCVVGSNDANFDGNTSTKSIAIATSA